MSAKILVMILASSLLGVGPLCRCEGPAQAKPRKASCGHCPKESAPQPRGCPVTDCCCVHEGSDRATEDQFNLPPSPAAFVLDLNPPKSGLPIETLQSESTELAGGVFRRAGPPLYLLFQNFII